MTITSTQKTEILKIAIGLFNAAPGCNYLCEMTNLVEDGMTISQLADTLATHPFFTDRMMAGRATTESQVAVLMDNFELMVDDTSTSAGSQAQAYFTNLISSGVGFGQIVYQAVKYLSDTPAPEFWRTAGLLDEKAVVAGDYSREHSSDDLSVLQNVLSGVFYSDPGLYDPVPSGTFVLTAGPDTIVGYDYSDTIIGDNTSINNSDRIDGGNGIDVFKVFVSFNAATNQLPTISNVETIYFISLEDMDQDFSALTQATTGIDKIIIGNASTLNGKTITTTSGQSLSLASSTATAGAVRWSAGITDTTLNLVLEGYQITATGTALSALTITGAAATTLNIDSAGAANQIGTFTGPATVGYHVITGDQSLIYTLAAADVTALNSINASANMGGVTVFGNVGVTRSGFVFTGGCSKDTITFADNEFTILTNGTQLNGGNGTDKIGLSDTVISAAEAAKIQAAIGFEKIGLNADITLNASVLSNYKIFDIDTPELTQVINNLATGSTVNVGIGARTPFTATSLTIAGAPGVNDVTINLGGAGDLNAHTISTLVTTGLTDIKISSLGTVANAITAVANSDNSNFTITGDRDLSISLAASTAINSQVDASAFGGKLTINGSDIIGSGDTIQGGNRVDTINGGKGADTMTGAVGADIFSFTATAGAHAGGITFGIADVITDFLIGIDKLQFSSVNDVVSGQQTSVQAAVTALTASATATQIADAMATVNTTNLGVSFAALSGNTYVLYETTGASTGAAADDIFIKLTGVTTAPTFAADVIA